MTAQEYTAAMRRIEQDNPSEVLLPVLRLGHSRTNEMYMRAAMKRCPTPDPTPIGRGDVESRERNAPPYGGGAGGGADDTLRTLWRERTRLFGEMNKQSNVFHTCKTDEERAANSAKVLAWWADIQAVKSKIAYYEQHGALPPVEEEGDELPDNAALLAKKLNSLRARISQMKKKLVDMAGLDPDTPGLQSKINAAEDDLKQLQYQAGRAAVKLKEYEQRA